jgi:general secretion pathway protein D
MVQADVPSNSLIITAAEPIYNNLRAVIERLDVRQPQVFVEALIVEVTADKAAELGVQWQALSQGSNTVFAGTNLGTTNNLITSATNRTIGQGFNLGILKGDSLGLLAHALESDTNANILSSPNLMTLDNEEAKIVVGQNVPFITGSYSNTGSNATTATPFQTIERKDVGLTLKIKPQILDGGSVRLQIYQEVSSVLASSTSSTSGVTTNKRSIDTSVLVDKNQIAVLGGLIQDSVSDVQSKTPLLGDIPFLGGLFRYDTRQRTKTNLMVFIRPHIMLTKDSYATVTNERYEQMSKTQDDAKLTSQFMMNVEGGPQLPEMNPSLKIDGGMPAQQSAQPETAK